MRTLNVDAYALITSRHNQRGVVIPLLALAMLVIVGITGLAADSGHAFLNKGRLQNALDAAALASATVLDSTGNQAKARATARAIFEEHLGRAGYTELRALGLAGSDLLVQFSDTRNPFLAHPAATRFVRVKLATGAVRLDTWFMRVFGVTSMDVGASALAGPSPALGEACNVTPILVCGDPSRPPDANGMYGYSYSASVTLVAGPGGQTGPGNFRLLRLGDSDPDIAGSDVRSNLAGGYAGCLADADPVDTEPGVKRGPVAQGINTRFGVYQGPVSSHDYPADLVTDAGQPGYPDRYSDYQQDYANETWDNEADGAAERRVISVVFGDCANMHGSSAVDVLGFGCVFLPRPTASGGAANEVQVSGELIRSCRGKGVPGRGTSAVTGLHTIQLYGDPDRWDS